MTTNFDRVLEKVFEATRRGFIDVVPGMRVDKVRKILHQRQHALVKIHGDAANRDERVLTLKDYETKYGHAEPLEALLHTVMTQPLLFLGCSLGNDRPVRALQKLTARFRRRKAEGMIAHYAVLEYRADATERRARLTSLARMGVKPIWFPTNDFDSIPELLQLLADRAGARPRVGTQRRLFSELTTGIDTVRGLTAVEQFLDLYLGSPGGEAPPCIGRTEELAALDAWLEQPGVPYALLAAPAGQGKSALITRWAYAVARSGRAQVAFAPASLRFETASASQFMELLGQRLRFLRERRSAAPEDARDWAAAIEGELRTDGIGKPLLVVLDGMDEASGWSVGTDLRFPPAPGAGIKVLVTARLLADRDFAGLGTEDAGDSAALAQAKTRRRGARDLEDRGADVDRQAASHR